MKINHYCFGKHLFETFKGWVKTLFPIPFYNKTTYYKIYIGELQTNMIPDFIKENPLEDYYNNTTTDHIGFILLWDGFVCDWSFMI